MATVEERLSRVEAQLARYGLAGPGAIIGCWFPGSLRLVRADKDGDGDFDPYTSTDWTGTPYSTGTGTINWTTDFGVPDGAKMVFVVVQIRDSSATDGAGVMTLRAKGTTTNSSFTISSRPSNVIEFGSGVVPVAPNGTSYYDITASGEDTCDIWILVAAYAR